MNTYTVELTYDDGTQHTYTLRGRTLRPRYAEKQAKRLAPRDDEPKAIATVVGDHQ